MSDKSEFSPIPGDKSGVKAHFLDSSLAKTIFAVVVVLSAGLAAWGGASIQYKNRKKDPPGGGEDDVGEGYHMEKIDGTPEFDYKPISGSVALTVLHRTDALFEPKVDGPSYISPRYSRHYITFLWSSTSNKNPYQEEASTGDEDTATISIDTSKLLSGGVLNQYSTVLSLVSEKLTYIEAPTDSPPAKKSRVEATPTPIPDLKKPITVGALKFHKPDGPTSVFLHIPLHQSDGTGATTLPIKGSKNGELIYGSIIIDIIDVGQTETA